MEKNGELREGTTPNLSPEELRGIKGDTIGTDNARADLTKQASDTARELLDKPSTK